MDSSNTNDFRDSLDKIIGSVQGCMYNLRDQFDFQLPTGPQAEQINKLLEQMEQVVTSAKELSSEGSKTSEIDQTDQSI